MKQIDSEKKLDRLKIDKLLKTIYSNHTTEEINFISNQLLQILEDFLEKSSYEEIRDKEMWNESHSVLITYADRAITNSFKPVRFFKTSFISFNAGRSNSSYKQGIKMLVDLLLRLLFNSLSKFPVTPYSCIVVIKPC